MVWFSLNHSSVYPSKVLNWNQTTPKLYPNQTNGLVQFGMVLVQFTVWTGSHLNHDIPTNVLQWGCQTILLGKSNPCHWKTVLHFKPCIPILVSCHSNFKVETKGCYFWKSKTPCPFLGFGQMPKPWGINSIGSSCDFGKCWLPNKETICLLPFSFVCEQLGNSMKVRQYTTMIIKQHAQFHKHI